METNKYVGEMTLFEFKLSEKSSTGMDGYNNEESIR